MRNGVLSVFGEVVSQVLSGSELSDQQRDTREQLLDSLQVSVVYVKVYEVWRSACGV